MIIVLFVLGIKLSILFLVFFSIILLITQIIYLKLKYLNNKKNKNIKIVSFVHPFCADCGGGEKVLWRMINSLISPTSNPNFNNIFQNMQKIKINIISAKKDDIQELTKKLKERFSIEIPSNNYNNFNNQNRILNNKILDVEIISLKSGYMLRPQNFGTMFFQILGQFYFAYEIITKIYSDIYCDTTGLPFTYFILKFLGHAKVTTYTHYPFISNDMIFQVKHNISGVHSRGYLTKFKLIKEMKLFYYKLILNLYAFMGNKCLSFAYVNSTWTFNHLKLIWNDLFKKENLKILYPPCSTSVYKIVAENQQRKNIIVSFAQFRPEKRQDLQIQIFQKLKENLKKYNGFDDLELHIIGGVRNNSDQEILDNLVKFTKQLNLENSVKFLKNGTTEQIIQEFSQAKIGIHTMVGEHFGITLIEMMAAGLIIITHNSAGAKDDIIVASEGGVKPGFLVEDENGYISQLEEILLRYDEIKSFVVEASKKKAEQFSDENFDIQFINNLNKII